MDIIDVKKIKDNYKRIEDENSTLKNENKKLNKEISLLKEQIKEFKDDIFNLYNMAVSLDIINDYELNDSLEEI